MAKSENKQLLIIFLIGIGLISITSLLLSFWKVKEQTTSNDRLKIIVSYIQDKSSFKADSNQTVISIQLDSLKRELELKSIKEDYYINQLNIQSTWIVAVITTLFVIFGLIQFGIFHYQISNIEKAYDQYKTDTGKKIHGFLKEFIEVKEKIENRFKELNSDIRLSFGNSLSISANLYDNTLNPLMAFHSYLLAIGEIAKSVKVTSKFDIEIEEFVHVNLHAALESLYVVQSISGPDKETKQIFFNEHMVNKLKQDLYNYGSIFNSQKLTDRFIEIQIVLDQIRKKLENDFDK